jgi:hypothetical protein
MQEILRLHKVNLITLPTLGVPFSSRANKSQKPGKATPGSAGTVTVKLVPLPDGVSGILRWSVSTVCVAVPKRMSENFVIAELVVILKLAPSFTADATVVMTGRVRRVPSA